MKRYGFTIAASLFLGLWWVQGYAGDVRDDIDRTRLCHMEKCVREYWSLLSLEEREVLLEILKDKSPRELHVILSRDEYSRKEKQAKRNEEMVEDVVKRELRIAQLRDQAAMLQNVYTGVGLVTAVGAYVWVCWYAALHLL